MSFIKQIIIFTFMLKADQAFPLTRCDDGSWKAFADQCPTTYLNSPDQGTVVTTGPQYETAEEKERRIKKQAEKEMLKKKNQEKDLNEWFVRRENLKIKINAILKDIEKTTITEVSEVLKEYHNTLVYTPKYLTGLEKDKILEKLTAEINTLLIDKLRDCSLDTNSIGGFCLVPYVDHAKCVGMTILDDIGTFCLKEIENNTYSKARNALEEKRLRQEAFSDPNGDGIGPKRSRRK